MGSDARWSCRFTSYLLFATAFLTIWLHAIAVFDRLTFWRIRPGQIVEQRLVGGGEHSYDTHGLVFDRRDQDFFRHVVLGLGAGDLLLTSEWRAQGDDPQTQRSVRR